MSPGLALFLYGVSSIPGEGTFFAPKVVIPGTLGLLMIAGFVWWSFKPKHPLLDLRLFRNRNLTVSVITMFAVRRGLLRRAAARAHLLPAGARRDRRCRPAG